MFTVNEWHGLQFRSKANLLLHISDSLYSSVFYRFRHIAPFSRKQSNRTLSPKTEETPSNFFFKLTMLTAETMSCFPVKTAWSYLQFFCHNTLALQTTTDDRQHLVAIAELAMQLQGSAKNGSVECDFGSLWIWKPLTWTAEERVKPKPSLRTDCVTEAPSGEWINIVMLRYNSVEKYK